MKNFAKGGVALIALALVATVFYVQPHASAALFLANESIQENNLKESDNTIKGFVGTQTVSENLPETSVENEIEFETGETNVEGEAKSAGTTFSATAYCLRGKTASGAMVRRGIVAADPRVLPLGTRIQISAGAWSGTYLVADTGGAIKGRILDIWVPSCGEATRFGRRKITVTVLGKGGKAKTEKKSDKKADKKTDKKADKKKTDKPVKVEEKPATPENL